MAYVTMQYIEMDKFSDVRQDVTMDFELLDYKSDLIEYRRKKSHFGESLITKISENK